jgi:uncharacterized RDD family membrane protein YckC
MEFDMNTSESIQEQTVDRQQYLKKAGFLNRLIARAIDLIIVVALYEIIPKVGYFAGITYLLIADGLFEGRSIGKILMGLKVVARNSGDTVAVCGIRESIFRNFPFAIGYILFGIFKAIPVIGWIISFVIVAVILLFEGLVMIGSEEGMRLGDEIAKTQVVEDIKGD